MSSHTQVISADALDNLRLMTERDPRSLESQMQRTLVPPLTYRGNAIEIHGQSIPKDEIGGDLVDLVTDDHSTSAYVADVSGHGLRAGVLMGMIKTAMRYGLMLRQPLSRLLKDLNRLLPGLKDTHMFATLAALRFDGSDEVEYISAGHVPLLHWRRQSREIVHHDATQLPLGLFADVPFTSVRIAFQPGDLLVLVSDGVVEAGEELDTRVGLNRLSELVSGQAQDTLDQLSSAIRTEICRLGEQHDDQTILLVRALGMSSVFVPRHASGSAFPELFEAGWRKLLEGLAAEVES